MPNINLIAPRRAEKKKVEQLTRQLFTGLVVSVGGFVLLTIYLGSRRVVLDTRLSEAKRKLAEQKPKLQQIADLEKAIAEVKPKVTTLEDAKRGTERYRGLFQVVSRSLPGNVWLGSMNSSGVADVTTVSMIGTSGSQTLVGELMTNLQKVPLFEKVDLKYTSLAAATEKSLERYSFQVDAKLIPPSAAPVPAGTPETNPAGTPNATPSNTPPAPRTADAVNPNKTGKEQPNGRS